MQSQDGEGELGRGRHGGLPSRGRAFEDGDGCSSEAGRHGHRIRAPFLTPSKSAQP